MIPINGCRTVKTHDPYRNRLFVTDENSPRLYAIAGDPVAR
jgi:hypothetical protein